MPPASPDVFSALPARPLHARPPHSIVGTGFGLFGLAVVAGMVVFLLAWVAPVIVTDWQVRDTAVRVRGASVSDGECSSKMFIQTCDVTLSVPASAIERRVHYVFGSWELGDFTVAVVADPAHPEWLTTDLGLDRFWDRIVTLLAGCAFGVAVTCIGSVSMIRAYRKLLAWRKAELVPVPLQMTRMQRVRNGVIWTVQAENGRTAAWTVPGRAKPFVLGSDGRVLGVATRGGAAIMPLDAELKWLDLSRGERAAAMAARPA